MKGWCAGLRAIHEAPVDLISNDPKIVPASEREHGFELGSRRGPARWVRRRIDHDHPSSRRDRRSEAVEVEMPAPFLELHGQEHRLCATHRQGAEEIRPGGRRHDHFVIGSRCDSHGHLDRMHAADRDEEALGRERLSVKPAHIGGDGVAKLGNSPLQGVEGLAGCERMRRDLGDEPRRWKIAFARPERNESWATIAMLEYLDDAAVWRFKRLPAQGRYSRRGDSRSNRHGDLVRPSGRFSLFGIAGPRGSSPKREPVFDAAAGHSEKASFEALFQRLSLKRSRISVSSTISAGGAFGALVSGGAVTCAFIRFIA